MTCLLVPVLAGTLGLIALTHTGLPGNATLAPALVTPATAGGR